MKTLIVLLLFLGCRTADARPRVREVFLRVYASADINACAALPAMGNVLTRLRALEPRLRVRWVFVGSLAPRPELLTLERFWDGSLFNYWRGQVGSARGISVVLLPPLDNGMTGGMTARRCAPRQNITIAQVKGGPENLFRDAAVIAHEVAHALGARDRAAGDTLMSAAVVAARHDDPALGFDLIDQLYVRQCLNMPTGRTVCRGRCN